MSKAPPVPHDQRNEKLHGGASPPSRDAEVSRDPAGGNAETNLKEQGAPANMRQNLSQPHNRRGR
jgi:hypothetical protein